MMTSGMFGGLSSLCLGTADFLGRFSSLAIDHYNALLGCLIAGFTLLSVWVVMSVGLPSSEGLSVGWIITNGVATTIMTLLLYLGLARGPVSVVAPIVTAHPILVILYYVLLHGNQLTFNQMTAITGTITGTILVAYKATNNNNKEVKSENTKSFRKTVFIALGSSLAYAVLVVAGQAASEIHGQIHTLWMGRLVSILFLLLIFYIRQRTPAIPIRWWPLLCVQGLLDTSGYIALFAGSFGPGKEIATVVAATFGGITVLLARIFLKENINTIQCSGIVLILGGVLVLSSQ